MIQLPPPHLPKPTLIDGATPEGRTRRIQSRPDVRVRRRDIDDFGAIQDLLERAYPPPHGPEAIWGTRNLLRHLARFPEGQLVAEDAQGHLIGTATSMRLPLGLALAPHTWSDITGRGSLRTHDPEGEALYGVNIAVAPEVQGQGVGRALYEARIQLGRRLGCQAFVAGARIPGYHLVANRMTPQAYLDAVVRGDLFDPTLSRQLRVGFQVRGLLGHYAPDPETLGHAALIVLDFYGHAHGA